MLFIWDPVGEWKYTKTISSTLLIWSTSLLILSTLMTKWIDSTIAVMMIDIPSNSLQKESSGSLTTSTITWYGKTVVQSRRIYQMVYCSRSNWCSLIKEIWWLKRMAKYSIMSTNLNSSMEWKTIHSMMFPLCSRIQSFSWDSTFITRISLEDWFSRKMEI